MKRALIVLSCCISFAAFSQRTELYFSHAKDFNYDNLKYDPEIYIADTTIWAVLFNTNPDLKLADIAGPDGLVTLTLAVKDRKVSWKVPLLSGIKKASKAGRLLAAARQTNIQEAFYFRVLPVSETQVTPEWRELFADLIEYSKASKSFDMKVKVGRYDRHFSVPFLEKGMGPYGEWGKRVYDARIVAAEQELARKNEEAKRKKHEEWIAVLDAGDKKDWIPTIFDDKALAKKMELAVREELGSEEEIFKVFIVEKHFRYNKNLLGEVTDRFTFFWAPAKSKEGFCYLHEGTLTQVHLGNGQFAASIDVHPTLHQYMRCEHMMEELKKYP